MTSRTDPSLSLGLAMVLSVCSLSSAQLFTKPFLSMPTPMLAGTNYILSCSSIVNGAQITYVWQRGDEVSPFSTSTSCNNISTTPQGIVSYECVSTYQLTAMWADNGVSITCTATLPSGRTKSDTGTFYIQIAPPSQYPEIIGNDTINAGQNVTYLCVADGAVPAVTLTWRVGSTSGGYSPPATANIDGSFRTVSYLYRFFTAADDGIQIHCDMSHPLTSGKRVSKTVSVQYKPTVSSSPSTYTLTEGVTGNLHCSYASKPSPTSVRWVKDNQVLDRSSGRFVNGDTPGSPSLTINNPQAEDAGTYVCIVSNVVGEGSGPSVTVVVRYKPKVTIPNASYGADISESLNIPCIIDADPTATSVTWYKTASGSTLPITSGSKFGVGTVTSPVLTIFNLLPDDAGLYQCEAGNILGTTRSNAVSVSISYAPTNIRAVPNDFEVDAGGDVLVTCIADAVPSPTYEWFFETDSSNPVSNSSVLSITATTPYDNGRYTCKATNEKGQASVIVGISVRFPPIINTSSSPQDVDEGSSVTLLCSVYSNPIPFHVTWYKNSQFLNRTNPGYSGGDSVASPHLTISNIQKSDSGNYHCEVPNLMGRTKGDAVTVRVVYPPASITINPSDAQTINEGDSLTLICVVNAVPSPTYEWRAGSQVIASLPILVINSAGPDDNRDVTCVGSNSKGNITKTVRVNVEYTPRVTIPGGDAFGADDGNNLTIPCVVDANPAVNTFQWLKDSAVLDLSDTSKYGGGTSASPGLTILALSSDDAGNYSCRAGNTRGQTSSRAVLVTISYQPKNVTVNQTSVTVIENEAILVTCSANAVPSPSFNWQKGGVEYQDGAYLNITSATPEDSGTYTCKVNNTKGAAEVSILVDVQYFPRVSSSAGEALIADTGDNVTIPCTIDANPKVTSVTWNMLNGSSQQPVDMSDNRYTGSTPDSPSLSVDNLTPEDAGRYQCKGENAVGTGSGSYVTVTIMFVPKEVSMTPSKVNVTEGETISVTCSSSAAPSATYAWLRNGDFYQNGATLSISSASTEDNATFMCQATNVKGTTNSSIDVNVSYRPRGILKNSIVTTTIGNSATLTCQTRANPPTSSYTWSFGSTQLAETGPSLTITPTSVGDFGQYTCVATNTIGSSEPISLNLQQETTPSPPNTGASTAALGTEIIVLIVLLFLILLIIIIVIIIVCFKKGKCGKKKETKGRVAPVIPPITAKTEATPTAVETSSTDAEKPSVRPRPQWSAVSRQDVHVNVNSHVNKEHDKMSVEDEIAGNGTIPNGAPTGGPIISIKDPDDTPRAHHLPPLHYGGGDQGEVNAEERKKRRRKKRRKRQDEGETTEQLKSDTIDEEEE